MSKNITRREALATVAGLGIAGILAGCGSQSGSDTSTSSDAGSSAAEDDVVVRVASLKGPTTIGLVEMMDSTSGIPTTSDDASSSDASTSDASTSVAAEKGSGITYSYTISGSPDEILPKVIQGETDIACVPSNAASVLYNKTDGKVQVIDVNTLGVLSVVTGDDSVREFEDLAGRTVYISGKGSSPEYVMDFLLDKAGISDQVTLEWKSEHTEVATQLASDPTSVGVLPQPFTTATLAKNDSLSAPVDLTDVWEEYVDDGSQFVMGVTIVRSEFADEHPAAVEDFLSRHAESVEEVNDDPESAAALVVEAGIVSSEAIAAEAIPECNVVCITGDDMRGALEGYLQVLYDADSSSVGGALPADDFYYAEG